MLKRYKQLGPARESGILAILAAMGRIDHDTRYRVLFRDEFRCVYCGRTAVEDGVVMEVDHMVPVCAGGQATMMNLVACCEACNLGKGDRTLPQETIDRIISARRVVKPRSSGNRYGEDHLREVANLRAEGFGYKAIARELGVSRDTAKYLVKRVERLAA